jgi:hypothetical protein
MLPALIDQHLGPVAVVRQFDLLAVSHVYAQNYRLSITLVFLQDAPFQPDAIINETPWGFHSKSLAHLRFPLVLVSTVTPKRVAKPEMSPPQSSPLARLLVRFQGFDDLVQDDGNG